MPSSSIHKMTGLGGKIKKKGAGVNDDVCAQAPWSLMGVALENALTSNEKFKPE